MPTLHMKIGVTGECEVRVSRLRPFSSGEKIKIYIERIPAARGRGVVEKPRIFDAMRIVYAYNFLQSRPRLAPGERRFCSIVATMDMLAVSAARPTRIISNPIEPTSLFRSHSKLMRELPLYSTALCVPNIPRAGFLWCASWNEFSSRATTLGMSAALAHAASRDEARGKKAKSASQ